MIAARRILRVLVKVMLACAVGAAFFEISCQLYAVHVIRGQEAIRTSPGHYFTRSTNAVLGYELVRDLTIERDDRVLRLNQNGIRDNRDEMPAADTIIAVLGDSVVFGKGLSQSQTITAVLQAMLDPAESRIKFLNLGVPGYSLPELLEHLKVKNDLYRADHIIYLLNPNDFCRRNTRYEGADNGLYRMYHPPRLKSLWFLRKLLYQMRKDGPVSVGWYRWIYRGTRARGLDDIAAMARYAHDHGATFTVVLLPAGCAYVEGGYALASMYDEIESALATRGIEVVSPIREFSDDRGALFTDTDHLTPEGASRMADVLARSFREITPDSP